MVFRPICITFADNMLTKTTDMKDISFTSIKRVGGANLRFISHILSLLLLSAVLLLATSCEKEINIVHDQLELYYEESTSLSTLDYKDVRKFDLEVGDFVYQYPDAKKDTLYPQIQANIHAAYTRLNLWPGDWGDQKTIEFEFGEE